MMVCEIWYFGQEGFGGASCGGAAEE